MKEYEIVVIGGGPAGRYPGMFSAPLGLSRQPIARMTAFARTCVSPSSRLTYVTVRSLPTRITMEPHRVSIPALRTCCTNRSAYSGPVSSS